MLKGRRVSGVETVDYPVVVKRGFHIQGKGGTSVSRDALRRGRDIAATPPYEGDHERGVLVDGDREWMAGRRGV